MIESFHLEHIKTVGKLLAPGRVNVKRINYCVSPIYSICIGPIVQQLRPYIFSLYCLLRVCHAPPHQDTLSAFWGFSNSCVPFQIPASLQAKGMLPCMEWLTAARLG